jgi:hypothetical protein
MDFQEMRWGVWTGLLWFRTEAGNAVMNFSVS